QENFQVSKGVDVNFWEAYSDSDSDYAGSLGINFQVPLPQPLFAYRLMFVSADSIKSFLLTV
ncbi:hypothetical protein Tco_0912055, partial [Tanacetum coccineum]